MLDSIFTGLWLFLVPNRLLRKTSGEETLLECIFLFPVVGVCFRHSFEPKVSTRGLKTSFVGHRLHIPLGYFGRGRCVVFYSLYETLFRVKSLKAETTKLPYPLQSDQWSKHTLLLRVKWSEPVIHFELKQPIRTRDTYLLAGVPLVEATGALVFWDYIGTSLLKLPIQFFFFVISCS